MPMMVAQPATDPSDEGAAAGVAAEGGAVAAALAHGEAAPGPEQGETAPAPGGAPTVLGGSSVGPHDEPQSVQVGTFLGGSLP